MSTSTSWTGVRAGVVRTATSVGLATGTYGVSFGALGTASGLTVAQTCALSVLLFSGGSQFALVGVLGGGGSGVSGTASAVLLGARNMVYATRLSTLLRLRGFQRLVGAQLVLDESTAVALSSDVLGGAEHGERAGRLGFWSTGLSVFLCWNLATLVGAVAGTVLGDPRTFGLDAAAPAAFLALMAPWLRDRTAWRTAVVAAVVALAVVPIVAPGVPVLVAAVVPVAGVLLGRWSRRWSSRDSSSGRPA